MKFNPEKHNRKSVRLKKYDYASNGRYFITICTQNSECIFGNIKNHKMILNTSGKIIKKWWLELLNKFTNIYLDEFTIMPNHFHSIIIINKNSKENIESINNTTDNKKDNAKIADIIKWFKTMTTNEYIRRIKSGEFKPFDKHLWQRNYYEHIIKNKKSYLYIINYIKNNPQNWHKDKFFTP